MKPCLIISQINPCAGDIEGNALRIKSVIEKFNNETSNLIVFPQLALTGYPPQDLLKKSTFIKKVREQLVKIAEVCGKNKVIAGAPIIEQGKLYNAAVLLRSDAPMRIIKNHLITNTSWFAQSEYFSESHEPASVIDFEDFPMRALISIDGELFDPRFSSEIHSLNAKSSKPLAIINLSARPYAYGNINAVHKKISAAASFQKLYIADANLVGGQDELILEGGSAVFGPEGQTLEKAPLFEEECIRIELSSGSEASPKTISSKTAEAAEKTDPEKDPFAKEAEQFKAICLGLGDYMRKTGFTDAVLGISGGIDSAISAAIAVEVLGKEHVHGIYMPSCYSSQISQSEGYKLCENLGIDLQVIPIEPIRASFTSSLSQAFAKTQTGVTEENLQARIRGTLVMAMSNKFGWLMLCTGNKDECACGYSTLYGDAAGGISPIADLYKNEIRAMCRYINRSKEIIPDLIITRPPSAELRPNQKDSDSLPDYDVLDEILYKYLELGQSQEEIIEAGFAEEAVKKAIRLINRSEFKRRQEPFGLRLTNSLFGLDRVMPMVNKYTE